MDSLVAVVDGHWDYLVEAVMVGSVHLVQRYWILLLTSRMKKEIEPLKKKPYSVVVASFVVEKNMHNREENNYPGKDSSEFAYYSWVDGTMD